MSLNKKRIGELYDLPIVTGDLNMVNNHELLLEMNDDNTPKALKQRVNGDLFKTILGEGSGGSNNPGYNVTKQTVTLFDDTIETQESSGVYQGVVENIDFAIVAGETYTVVFDGVSYDIEAVPSPFPVEEGEVMVIMGDINGGNPSFETYPFYIMYDKNVEEGQALLLLSKTEGSHTVVIKHEEETVTTTQEFKDAVDSVTGYSIDKESETLFDGTVETADSEGYISGIITPTITFVEGDIYKVTFNGIEYICKCLNDYIGAPYIDDGFDWSAYPFSIDTYNSGDEQFETELITNQEGSYTLKIEHLSVSTKTTPEFESMIQGIAGGSTSGCQIIYPDDIVWTGSIYSKYNKEPEAGNIYFMPFVDNNDRRYLFPVYIIEFINDGGIFSGSAEIIGTPVVTGNETLFILDFDGEINPTSSSTSGLQITWSSANRYRLRYKDADPFG